MVYAIVNIRKCLVGDEYVQNHYDNSVFEKLEEAQQFIKEHSARKLGEGHYQRDIPDIRRHIINERGEIYGYFDDNDEVHYFALVEMEESRRNKFLDE